MKTRCDNIELKSTKESIENKVDKHVTDLEDKVDNYVKDLYSFNWKIGAALVAMVLIIASTIFTYIHISKSEHESTAKGIQEALTTLQVGMTKIDKTVSNIEIEQRHLKEEVNELKTRDNK